jgi:hypothetical protein
MVAFPAPLNVIESPFAIDWVKTSNPLFEATERGELLATASAMVCVEEESLVMPPVISSGAPAECPADPAFDARV